MTQLATDPRQVSSGTSYSADGLLDPPEIDTEKGSARFAEPREIVPELVSQRQRILTFDKMINSDVAPDISLRAAKAPILGGDFFIEPYSDQQLDLDIAEFVETNLFNRITQPWSMVLEDMLRCLDYGYSVMEPVWTLWEWGPKRSNANRKKYTMLKKIAPRPTPTIKSIEYDDNGGPVQIIQAAIDSKNKVSDAPIPIEKLIILPFNRKGGNLEGRSVLRSAYPHWVYKTKLYKIDAIQKERHAIGVPKVKLMQGYKTADKIAAHELGRNIRTNEWGHMVLPPGLDVEFAELNTNPVDVIPSIEHHNAMIMLNVLLEFLLAGIDAGGGRATSATQIDMFLKSSIYMANQICAVFNQFVIPKLVGYNFKTVGMPILKARNIGQSKDLQQFAAAMKNLASGDNPVIMMDEETENWVRSQIHMPHFHGKRISLQKQLAEIKKPAQPANPANQNQGQNGNQQNGAAQGGNTGAASDTAG